MVKEVEHIFRLDRPITICYNLSKDWLSLDMREVTQSPSVKIDDQFRSDLPELVIYIGVGQIMCKECSAIAAATDLKVSGLIQALSVFPQDEWEPSEPIAVGGPAGAYAIRAPYVGDCEWAIDTASAGAGANPAIILVSSQQARLAPGFIVTDPGTGENTGIDGMPVIIPPGQCIPISSRWYPMRNSENSLFIKVTNTLTAAYVVFQFRQKRGSKNGR